MIEQSLLKQNLKPASDQGVAVSGILKSWQSDAQNALPPDQKSSRTLGLRTFTNYHPRSLVRGSFFKVHSLIPASCLQSYTFGD